MREAQTSLFAFCGIEGLRCGNTPECLGGRISKGSITLITSPSSLTPGPPSVRRRVTLRLLRCSVIVRHFLLHVRARSAVGGLVRWVTRHFGPRRRKPSTAPHGAPGHHKPSPPDHWGFILTYCSLLVAFVAFGYQLTDSHIFWAAGLFVVALLQLILGMWLWFGKAWKTYVKVCTAAALTAVSVSTCYRPFANALRPTYVYLIPTRNLIDAERRAFFVQQVGPRAFDNVTIALVDNKAGTARVQVQDYPKIDQGSGDSLAPRYFWFRPSSPWDEDYTITVTSSGNPRLTQRMIVRNTHHVLQFAVEVRIDGVFQPAFTCRDRLMPQPYRLALGANETCDKWMSVSPNLERRLEPSPYGVELPNGAYVVQRLRTLPDPRDLETQSENRHLWEYQRAKIISEIAEFPRARLLILATSGQNTQAYARDLRDTFRWARWAVSGPKAPPPQVGEAIIDVQVSAAGGTRTPEVSAVLAGLEKAGVKHRKHCILDPDVPHGLTVLWVGPRSPDNISPDSCAPASVKPRQGEPKPCECIDQTPEGIPLPPP
jgi:hypothetical protein